MSHPQKTENSSADIQTGLQVLDVEIAGLEKLKAAMNDDFAAAVQAIVSMKAAAANGRLIVAGIGKSGHVARKIAATMASTGTPAYFVHPGEASHGDLGMITESDIVLMLSNSGENMELSDLIHYTRRYGITLIAMTSNAESTLAKHSDIVLLMPKTEEACPNGLAPTTSTTMMMAFGDCLSVALLERMGLTSEQFKAFHPGGKLGQKLLGVADLMVDIQDAPLIDASAKMDEAILTLAQKNMGVVIVVDSAGALKGIITDGDLKRHMAADLLQKPVKEVMSASPKTISRDKLAAQAVDIMTKTPGQYLTSLIVTDEKGALAGLIRLQDCLQAGVE